MVARWMVSALEDAGAPAYNATVPPEAPDPRIVFSQQGGRDLPVMGSGPRVVRFTYLVRAISATESATALEALADAIDAALEKASGSATTPEPSLTIISVLREQPFDMVEIVDGVVYRHLGGIYAIHAQEV